MRCFIGLPVPASASAALQAAVAPLQRAGGLPVKRWSHPADYHLTLAFLGEIGPERVPALIEAMVEAAVGVAPFSLRLERLEPFPGRRPVVLAAMPAGHQGPEQLHLRLLRELLEQGIALEDRRFQPHLSLARLQARPLPALPALAPITLPVTELALYASDTRARGARYTVLARVRMQPAGSRPGGKALYA